MKNIFTKWLHRAISALTLTMLITGANVANAAILFQDDTFHDINSEALLVDADGTGTVDTGIQFGNDSTLTNNGTINWNVTTDEFEFDHTIDITGDLDVSGNVEADGNVDFSAASQTRLRENADPATNSACSSTGELIVDTTDDQVQICTATGVAGAATWTAIASSGDANTLDGLDSLQFLRSDTSDSFTSGTLTTSAGTTVDVDGAADFSGSTQFIMRTGAANPGTCTEGELFYNSTTNVLATCTATDTWTSAGPQDFESVYGADADNTLTTGGTDFTVASGGGDLLHTVGAGEFDVTGTGLLDFNMGSFDMDLSGTFAVDAVGASNLTTDSGNLTLSTTTSGDLALNGADDVTLGAGDDIIFDDAQLTGVVQLTDTATDWAATFSGDGIIDNINEFTLTTAGNGASNVGTETGSFSNISPATDDVQAALLALDSAIGAEVERLLFYPEYPDTIIYGDGSGNGNKGRLDAEYDAANSEHFYRWTSQKALAQNMDLRFRFALPDDFFDVNDFTFRYRTGTGTAGDNAVSVTVNNDTDSATCGSSLSNVNAGAWATGTITEATLETGCTGGTVLNAGDIVEVIVKLLDNSGDPDYADIGYVELDYDNS